jgi:hypothetical protein
MTMIPAMDDTRKKTADGLERRLRWLNTRILSVLPIKPKIKMNIER